MHRLSGFSMFILSIFLANKDTSQQAKEIVYIFHGYMIQRSIHDLGALMNRLFFFVSVCPGLASVNVFSHIDLICVEITNDDWCQHIMPNEINSDPRLKWL